MNLIQRDHDSPGAFNDKISRFLNLRYFKKPKVDPQAFMQGGCMGRKGKPQPVCLRIKMIAAQSCFFPDPFRIGHLIETALDRLPIRATQAGHQDRGYYRFAYPCICTRNKKASWEFDPVMFHNGKPPITTD